MTLSITLWYSRNRWRSMPFEAMAFNTDSPFLHLSFVDSTCVLYVSILSKWIPRYLRQFVRSVASPLKETAGIACSTALLLRVHHREWQTILRARKTSASLEPQQRSPGDRLSHSQTYTKLTPICLSPTHPSLWDWVGVPGVNCSQ